MAYSPKGGAKSPMMDEFRASRSTDHGDMVTVEETEDRGRWSSRVAFILAAVGSAIGLGNFWRFPYLLFKYGGGIFLIPYFLALFIVGIPVLQVEITLGQLLQAGPVKALGRLSPMVSGIGAASGLVAFLVVSYYSMIISWVLIYFVQSFKSELPWDGISRCMVQGSDGSLNNATSAEYYLYREVLGFWTEEFVNDSVYVCGARAGDNSEGIQWEVFGAMAATWFFVYLCLVGGVHNTSKVVYVTVTLPVVILLILLFRAVTLEGASLGIDAYIVNWDFSRLQKADIWVDAVSQIFFSLSVASSIMIPYGSYNRRDKPVLADTFIIAILNSLFSFTAGFAVWGTLGYYADSQGLTIDQLNNVASLGLVFITYPVALSQLSGTQFWCVMLFLNLFMLGIDSAFSLVEGYFAIVEDSFLGKKLPRPALLLISMAPCMCLGLFYCQDTGLYWFDAVDHYVQNIMLLVGAMECFAVGWMRGTATVKKSINELTSYFYTLGYVLASVLFVALTVGTANAFRTDEELDEKTGPATDPRVSNEVFIGFAGLIVMLGIFWTLAVRHSGMDAKSFFEKVAFTGPSTFTKFWKQFAGLGNGTSIQDKAINFYTIYWSLLVKYFLPVALFLLLCVSIRTDSLFPYGGYMDRFQNLGWIIFAIGCGLVFGPMVFLPLEPVDGDVTLAEAEDVVIEKELDLNDVTPGKEVNLV